ncbi:MAG: hypothetical protein Q8R29_02575 [bacterium]|nr:hypothetical protein [bacterium]
MRFFKFIIAALVFTSLNFNGCASGSSPTSSETERIFFDKLDLPSYDYVNGELPLYRMVLKANEKNINIESFAWEIYLQQLTLNKLKLFAYKDSSFTSPAYDVNPIAVNNRQIPDGKPDYYYGQYPLYTMSFPIDLAGKNRIALPLNVPIYFELKALMGITGSEPSLGIYLEGAYLSDEPAAKKPVVLEYGASKKPTLGFKN